jgi:ParB family chromosome partitioning protein
MTNKTIRPENKAKANLAENQIENMFLVTNGGEYKELPIYKIDYSPFNYRKLFSEKDLESFAAEILLHGIISPLTVRQLPSGNYELVAGERRLRAATIAGIVVVPVVVKEYTDEQVREIQLAENLQRENPHPLHEAFAIGQMQASGKKIDEISARLGKSKQFIYTRIKLLSLIEAIQEMFLNDAINLQEAVEIASLSAESQIEFFQSYCRDWKKRKNFEITNLDHKLDQFKYDLKKAPFKTSDKKLVPGAGSCTTCAFNTATLKSLFPEFAKQANLPAPFQNTILMLLFLTVIQLTWLPV